MKHIVAVNASPRAGWNTDLLVHEAAAGAEAAGAAVELVQLYGLERFTGCVSCFGCKTEAHFGACVCRDGLSELLAHIRAADGLILGTPVYMGDVSAGFRALFERLIYQYVTYQPERPCCNERRIPVVFLLTSGAPAPVNAALEERYRAALEASIGPVSSLLSGDTLQVPDYSKFHWTMFDPAAKLQRRETVFPEERKAAFALGAALAEHRA